MTQSETQGQEDTLPPINFLEMAVQLVGYESWEGFLSTVPSKTLHHSIITIANLLAALEA